MVTGLPAVEARPPPGGLHTWETPVPGGLDSSGGPAGPGQKGPPGHRARCRAVQQALHWATDGVGLDQNLPASS